MMLRHVALPNIQTTILSLNDSRMPTEHHIRYKIAKNQVYITRLPSVKSILQTCCLVQHDFWAIALRICRIDVDVNAFFGGRAEYSAK